MVVNETELILCKEYEPKKIRLFKFFGEIWQTAHLQKTLSRALFQYDIIKNLKMG